MLLGANSNSPLRGDYSKVGADFATRQDMAAYTETDRAVWKQLIERQPAIVKQLAAPEFLEGLAALDLNDEIPDFEKISDRIEKRTGWRLLPVPGFIPNDVFFRHLANRRFPVSVWVRKPEELDYLVEPDLFHDFFGHVPLLINPVFADYLQRYGAEGLKTTSAEQMTFLSRLYWYMVEFGLIHTKDGLKAYGSGMLSSKAETIYSVESPKPNRVWFDLVRVMRTSYMIDDFQKTYFVLPDFGTLFKAMDTDFAALYEKLSALPTLDPALIAEGDRVYSASA